ncbi:MAG TPA: prenyltransferase/squalene oxidase repeat-containing protein [Ruminiclostridium sp.]|nr:prenyltransferase/squalene oxidase repeat-containing protein [Ruminiclostridium sp.]
MATHLEKAIQFVNNNGDSFQKNYFASLFGADNLQVTLEKLSEYQNPDGGWIRIDPDYQGTVSSITCTMGGFGKLERLNVEKSELINRSIAYLRQVQKATGMWDEPDEIISFNPPRWYFPRISDNRIWFTNGMLRYVISRKPEEKEMISNARQYLRPFWGGSSFPGYDHNNWMGIVSFSNSDCETDMDIYQGCLKNLRRDIRNYDLADVVWTLESCYFLKLPVDEEVVSAGIELLLSGQSEDGGFGTEYGEFQRADVTIEALDSLANYGVVPRRIDIFSGE